MSETILVCIAWPYANAEIHVGNITGSHLPGDIFARYHRLKGNRVLMVSGTDSHGTPVTLRADALGKPIEEVYKSYHNGFLDLFQQLGIHYDLFTSTHTQNHFKVSQDIFLALNKNGFLYTETRPQWYSPASKRFLPDRYVEGTCYFCGFEGARSDQCDNCGNVLEPEKLIDPRSKVDGSTPELRDTEHFYLDLSKLEAEIAGFLNQRKSFWRDTVIGQSLGQIESEGLKPRAITRDLDWGIPVPLEGWQGKCLYVWFEAVIGYLSATIESTTLQNDPKAWEDWWTQPDAKAFYFIGKDNIFFHAAWWPAQLMGTGEQFMELYAEENGKKLTLPFNVPANQFMNLENRRISGGRNWAIWGRDFLARYDPDPLRYYLTVNMPEMRDTDWDWQDFYNRNNTELVAKWGNVVNRVLPMIGRHWQGVVPEPGELTPLDLDLLEKVEGGFETVGKEIEAVHLRAALEEVMRLSKEVDGYLERTAPWNTIKTDKAAAGRSLYTALRAIDSLKILFAPFVPFSCERLHTFLAYPKPLFGKTHIDSVKDSLGEHSVLHYRKDDGIGKWEPSRLAPGIKLELEHYSHLIKKLDPSIVEEERAKLGKPQK